MRVRDYMSTALETLAPTDRLLDADLLVRRAGVRHIPVLAGGQLVGLLSERDIRRYAPSILDNTAERYNRIFEEVTVEMVMTKGVATISPDVKVVDAVRLMLTEQRGCLPVVEGDKLVGIITRRDILKIAYTLLGGDISEL